MGKGSRMLDELYILRGLVLRGKSDKEAKVYLDALVTRLGGSFTRAFNQVTREWAAIKEPVKRKVSRKGKKP